MNDLILNLVKFNEDVDFTVLIPLLLIYFAIFWLIVSVWVFMDSKSRLKSKKKALALSILNFIFGIPFLLLYILARPFDDSELSLDLKDDDTEHSNNASYGGVNVPVVNFMGKDGVVMSLEIKINPKSMDIVKESEMKIDVSFDSKDESKKIIESTEILSEKIEELKDEVKKNNSADSAGKVSSFFKKLFSKTKTTETIKKVEDKKEEKKPDEVSDDKNFLSKQNFQVHPNTSFKKKKKKKKNK